MKIEFKDEDYIMKPIPDGVYVAEVVDIRLTASEKKFIKVVFFIPDLHRKIVRIYPTVKGERWKFKLFLKACGVEKDEKKNMYIFDTDDLIGKKVVITVTNNRIIKTESYVGE